MTWCVLHIELHVLHMWNDNKPFIDSKNEDLVYKLVIATLYISIAKEHAALLIIAAIFSFNTRLFHKIAIQIKVHNITVLSPKCHEHICEWVVNWYQALDCTYKQP